MKTSGSGWWPERPAMTLAQGRGNNCIVAKMASVGLKRSPPPDVALPAKFDPDSAVAPFSSCSFFIDSFGWTIRETAGRISSIDPSSSSAKEISTYDLLGQQSIQINWIKIEIRNRITWGSSCASSREMTLSSAGSESSRRTNTGRLFTTAVVVVLACCCCCLDGGTWWTILRDKIQWCNNLSTIIGSIRTGKLFNVITLATSSSSPPCVRTREI